MKDESSKLERKFIGNWILANGIGWLVGAIGAFVLSAFVVNIFYDKETNLIVGLCIGASMGYAQWLVLKRSFKISSLWGLVFTICLGIPFIVSEIFSESGINAPSFPGDHIILSRPIIGLIAGSVIGILQIKFLKPYFKSASRWVLVSSIGWGICGLVLSAPMPMATFAMLFTGVLMGVVTGFGIIWMNRSES